MNCSDHGDKKWMGVNRAVGRRQRFYVGLKVRMTDRNMGRQKGRRRQTDTNNRLVGNILEDRLAVFPRGRVTSWYKGSQA